MRRLTRVSTLVLGLVGCTLAGFSLAPAAVKDPPPGATALCKDGTYSYSATRSGTCSHHGGVAVWLAPTPTTIATPPGSTTPASTAASTTTNTVTTSTIGPATTTTQATTRTTASGDYPFPPQTVFAGCRAAGPLPESSCTPGADFSFVTTAQICVAGYSSSVRDVTTSRKNAVYAEYSVGSHPTGSYEIDHLVPLELGGSNDTANLWPEAASPKPGFHEKDRIENALHSRVCSGALSLWDAQRQIAANWLAVGVQIR